MQHFHALPPPFQPPGDIHQAAEIPGGQRLRPAFQQIVDFRIDHGL